MRTRSSAGRAARVLALGAVALAAGLLLAVSGGQSAVEPPRSPSVAWQGLVGEPRPAVVVGQRMLVVLNLPSLAARVAAAGGQAGDRQQRAWTRQAGTAQRLFISRMGIQGAEIEAEFSYTRVLNGFSAPLDPRAIALLERAEEVEGIYPVRPAYPAASLSSNVLARRQFAPGRGRRPEVVLPGFDGRGVTVALLDTGVDRAQPYLQGRVAQGVDVVDGGDRALAAPKPDNASELERHGTQLAGLIVGVSGPGGLAGVAPGATVLPIRVAGWQPDASGAWAVYSRTDQVLAGLERAVDPNGDGDALDAARIALVGVVEPYAAFATGPLARAVAGARRLDTLVVTPAGNDGPAGPGFGSIAGPGGAPAALTVGAADLRTRHDRARLVLRAGLNVLVDRLVPLAGAVPPVEPVTLRAAAPRLLSPGDPAADQAASLELGDFFDAGGFSLVAGRAAVVPAGGDALRVARAAARAGAAAIVLFGPELPAGALGLDERIPVPVVGVSEEEGRALLEAIAAGRSTGVSLVGAEGMENGARGTVAGFSSRGTAFDGRVKPELVAAGVGVATSEPGGNEDGSPRYGTMNGSSVSAAIVAGAAALLAQARPELDAAALKSALVGAAQPLGDASFTQQGAGLVDVVAAAATELAAEPAALGFGRATVPEWTRTREVTIRNVSTRPLTLTARIERRGFPAAEVAVRVEPRRLQLRPGASAVVRVLASAPAPAQGGPPAEGTLVVEPRAGRALRVPFAIPFGPPAAELLGAAALSQASFEPSDTAPAVLSLQAGLVRTAGELEEVQPVRQLDIELWTGGGRRVGVLARLRNILPGNYSFGITGRDPAGQLLRRGPYELRLIATPTEGRPTRRSVEFTIE